MPRAWRFIISHRVYTQRMLLKAEFQPQSAARAPIDRAIEAAGQIILGKETQVRLALACLLARGHLLIEDLPGVGKTTLAHVLARSLGLQFQRIQFTSDMLPADILGVSIYERDSGGFKFHPGPIFAQVILADEVNRATPKTQSALLEAMEEHQVTAEGETRKLPAPFFVIATQNPSEQVGTFPLPESQLDRFMMRIELGYPDRDAERALLSGTDRRDLLATLDPCMSPAELMELQAGVQKIAAAAAAAATPEWFTGPNSRMERVADPVFGGSVALYRAGKAGAEPVVLVHGLGKAGAEDWAKVVPALAERYDVYALDLHGFGQSDKGNHLYSPSNYARSLEGVLGQRLKGPFTLVGHSMGGAVALAFAAAYPARVRRLVLVDAAGVLHRSVYAEYLG